MVELYKGKESIFKKPMPKLRKPSFKYPRTCHLNRLHKKPSSTPAYKKNPDKWVKYSLKSTSDVTNESNTATAFSFLNEIAKRKKLKQEGDIEEPQACSSDGKIFFKKPNASKKLGETASESEKKKMYRDGKLCMPAFDFGCNIPSKATKKGRKSSSDQSGSSAKTNSLNFLSHLKDDENNTE